MNTKIADLELKLDVNALYKMPAKRLGVLFANPGGFDPKELSNLTIRMLREITEKTIKIPIGLYTLNVNQLPFNNYLFRMRIGYSDDFIYPEFFGYDKKEDEIRYFPDS